MDHYEKRICTACHVVTIIALLALLLGAYALANAATPAPITVQHNGTTQFQTDAGGLAIAGSVWNFVDSVAPPPFNPPNDPNALNTIVAKFLSHTCGTLTTNNGQSFAELYGRLEGTNIVVTAWPFRPSTGFLMNLPAHGRYYGGVFQLPANPGLARHFMTADLYGGSCRPTATATAGARINVSVVAVGNTAAPSGACAITGHAFDFGTLVTFDPIGQTLPPAQQNRFVCSGSPGGTYRYIVENAGAAQISALLTWH